MARYDDLNTSAIGYATFISTILFVIIVLLIRALSFYWVEGEADRLQANTHYTTADAEISEQRERLSGYAKEMVTVFKGEGDAAVEEEVEQLHIPLDAAKAIILDQFGSGDHSEDDHAADGHDEGKGDEAGHSEEAGHGEEESDSAGESEPDASTDEKKPEESDDKDA